MNKEPRVYAFDDEVRTLIACLPPSRLICNVVVIQYSVQ
jgi:hypothetical protein